MKYQVRYKIGNEVAMRLQDEIRQRLAHCSYRDIAELMGYHKVDNRMLDRIHAIFTDPYLGLHSGYYDFKYTGIEFIEALCSLLNISFSDFTDEIDSIEDEYLDKKNRFKSFVFIDTGFKRQSQPIFMLMALEHYRYLYLDYEIRLTPLANQIDYVKKLIREHYKNNDGDLDMWGIITKYSFCYDEGKYIEFTPDGDVLGETDGKNISRAEMRLNNKNLTPLIINNINESDDN